MAEDKELSLNEIKKRLKVLQENYDKANLKALEIGKKALKLSESLLINDNLYVPDQLEEAKQNLAKLSTFKEANMADIKTWANSKAALDSVREKISSRILENINKKITRLENKTGIQGVEFTRLRDKEKNTLSEKEANQLKILQDKKAKWALAKQDKIKKETDFGPEQQKQLNEFLKIIDVEMKKDSKERKDASVLLGEKYEYFQSLQELKKKSISELEKDQLTEKEMTQLATLSKRVMTKEDKADLLILEDKSKFFPNETMQLLQLQNLKDIINTNSFDKYIQSLVDSNKIDEVSKLLKGISEENFKVLSESYTPSTLEESEIKKIAEANQSIFTNLGIHQLQKKIKEIQRVDKLLRDNPVAYQEELEKIKAQWRVEHQEGPVRTFVGQQRIPRKRIQIGTQRVSEEKVDKFEEAKTTISEPAKSKSTTAIVEAFMNQTRTRSHSEPGKRVESNQELTGAPTRRYSLGSKPESAPLEIPEHSKVEVQPTPVTTPSPVSSVPTPSTVSIDARPLKASDDGRPPTSRSASFGEDTKPQTPSPAESATEIGNIKRNPKYRIFFGSEEVQSPKPATKAIKETNKTSEPEPAPEEQSGIGFKK